MTKYPHLRQLGRAAALPASPDKAVLETVPNPQPRALYLVRFTAPEFTTLCPMTGQPDFAHLVIDYAPRARLVESKSLKLYLGSFRNHADFHEACTLAIGQRIMLFPHEIGIQLFVFPVCDNDSRIRAVAFPSAYLCDKAGYRR